MHKRIMTAVAAASLAISVVPVAHAEETVNVEVQEITQTQDDKPLRRVMLKRAFPSLKSSRASPLSLAWPRQLLAVSTGQSGSG